MENRPKNYPVFIGLVGYAKSGKDTAARGIQTCVWDLFKIPVSNLAFADTIRKIGLLFGYTKEQMSDQSLKETFCNPMFPMVTPRKFMQLVGSEMFRNHLDKDCWVKIVEKVLLDDIEEAKNEIEPNGNPTHVRIITDVRFPNEAEMIKKHGGFLVRVKREGLETADWQKHESEAYIDKIEVDYTLVNDSPTAKEFGSRVGLAITGEFLQSKGIFLHA